MRPPRSIASSWAAVSTPAARPLVTVTSCRTSSRTSLRVRLRASGEAFRDPTTDTRRPDRKSPSSPATNSFSGACFLSNLFRGPSKSSGANSFTRSAADSPPCSGTFDTCRVSGRVSLVPWAVATSTPSIGAYILPSSMNALRSVLFVGEKAGKHHRLQNRQSRRSNASNSDRSLARSARGKPIGLYSRSNTRSSSSASSRS